MACDSPSGTAWFVPTSVSMDPADLDRPFTSTGLPPGGVSTLAPEPQVRSGAYARPRSVRRPRPANRASWLLAKITVVSVVLLGVLLLLGAMRFFLPDPLQALSADVGAVVGLDIPDPDEAIAPASTGVGNTTVSTPTFEVPEAPDFETEVSVPPMPPPSVSLPTAPSGY